MKRILSLLLTAILLFSSLPLAAFTAWAESISASLHSDDQSESVKAVGETVSDVLDPLSQEIEVQRGQLMPETCEVSDSEIYAYVKDYKLKKGHTLSIANTDYVFSVRKYVDGNYSTMLKSATSASFIATEDMTVGMLIRKPDKTALTDEEIAGIVLYDTQYGMKDVEGYAHRFTVEADTVDGGTATTRCALFLPTTYTETGDATKLLMMSHGYSGYLTDSVWYGNQAHNIQLIDAYLQAGFTVYVVDNTAASTSQTADLGCPQLVDSYFKAFEYITSHFNVEDKISIHSRSFGTFAAARFMREHPELVKCALMTGPRVSLQLAYNSVDKAFVANRFGFSDSTGATYEADKLVGYNPYVDVDGEEYALPPTFWMMSEGDSTAEPETVIKKMVSHGNTVLSKTYTGTNHTGVCALNSDEMMSDALAFLSQYQTTESLSFQGKVISVLGDSISTFAGYIPTADGFNLEHLARYPQDDLLTDVNETWWMQVVDRLDAKLGINDSWRGATVTGAVPVTTGTSGANAAFGNLTRIQNLGSNGTPDVILFYGGTNDLAHVSAIGLFDAATAPSTADLTTKSWDNLADGYVQTLLRLKYYYPDAMIVAILPAVTETYYSTEKLLQANKVLAQICEYYEIPYTDLSQSDLNVSHLPDGIHPGKEGMDIITESVCEVLLSQSEIVAGEHTVYTVTHQLQNATVSKPHFKGISEGAVFEETLTGKNLSVSVIMGGNDITSQVYADGKIRIESVTGNLVITVTGAFDSHLQTLPEQVCAGTNLWTALNHDREYYTASGWSVHSSGNVYSVTLPTVAGDRIFASSFGKASENGSNSLNGIRVTFFGIDGVLVSMSAGEVYAEFSVNGYLTAPEGTVAVNVPMWNNSDENELYLLNREHTYTSTTTAPTCTEQGYTTYTCSACGNSYTDNVIPATGHKMGEWYTVTAPTCTTTGTDHRDCENCDHYETRTTNALGHDLTTHTAKVPTCTAIGWNAYETCSRCDYTTYAELPALGHTESVQTVLPTCTEDGYQKTCCDLCDMEFSHSVLSAKGHHYVYGQCTECGDIEFLYGDVNGDGRINGQDATRLCSYLSWRNPHDGSCDISVAKGADVDGDGAISGTDFTRLMRYLAFLDPATGVSSVVLGPQK